MKIHFIFGTYRLKKIYEQQHQKKESTIVKDQQKYEVERIIEE